MRVISQDGKFDFPYEKCCIWINDNKIKLYPLGEPDSAYVLAMYSTNGKAEKTMEMLHKAYTGMPIIFHNIESDDPKAKMFSLFNKNGIIVKQFEDTKSKVEYVSNIIFQFPKDEEIEV